MAQSIALTSGSLLIGSPIAVTVKSEKGLDKATFHRVKLIVSAAMSTDPKWQNFELSAPAGSNEDIVFDISTALRSVAARYTHGVVTQKKEYPYIMYTLKAYDEWMLNGLLTEHYGERILPAAGNYYALFGAFTERERYASTSGTRSVTTFTRKPHKGEVVGGNDILVVPIPPSSPLGLFSAIEKGPEVDLILIGQQIEGENTFYGHTVYVDHSVRDRMLFQFVNGYGVIETISAEMLESAESNGETEIDVITAPSSFGNPRLSVSRRGNRTTTYKCSSGYVNREWAEWWTNEFLGGDSFRRGGHNQCWVRIDGSWLPCVVVPEEDITLYDRTKPGLTQIEFEVRVL